MTAAEQLNHIADGDFVWCDECGGSGSVAWFDLGVPLATCHICDGDGIVFAGDDERASTLQLEAE